MTNSGVDPQPNCRALIRRYRRVRARTDYHGPGVSLPPAEVPPSQPGDVSRAAQGTVPMIDLDKFPEDILCHILSLLPLRDAARTACVSHKFLSFWRCFPNLTLNPGTFDLNVREGTSYERAKELVGRIDHIIQNHSGVGVKTLELDVRICDRVTAGRLDIWLQAGISSGILEISLELPQHHRPEYNFPCSLLSCAGSSLQSISLFSCAFHPTLGTGCFKSLKRMCLILVHINGKELGCLLSSTVSLENLEISHCDEITLLNIPSHLQQLSTLKVSLCKRLQMMKIYAPNITTFLFRGPPMEILISNSSQLKYMTMDGSFYFGMIQYAWTKLHSIAPNLQTLILSSNDEGFSTPMLSGKFLHLRRLNIYFPGKFQSYDYFSLVSFLEACPALETFLLSAGDYGSVRQDTTVQDSNADSLYIRRNPEFHHANLKKVSINQLSTTKSLIELTCQIVESTPSLQCLVLNTTRGFYPGGMCRHMYNHDIIEAHSAVEAAKRYIEGRVPPSVKFKVLGPCTRCHIVDA